MARQQEHGWTGEKRGQGSDKLSQLAARRAKRGEGGTADWSGADGSTIVNLIAAAARDGVVISFGYTRDGGAYIVGLFADGDRVTEYCRPAEDLDQFLTALATDYFGG